MDHRQHSATEQVIPSFEDVPAQSRDIVDEVLPVDVCSGATPAGDTQGEGKPLAAVSGVIQVPDVEDDARSTVSSSGKTKSLKKGKKKLKR